MISESKPVGNNISNGLKKIFYPVFTNLYKPQQNGKNECFLQKLDDSTFLIEEI